MHALTEYLAPRYGKGSFGVKAQGCALEKGQ